MRSNRIFLCCRLCLGVSMAAQQTAPPPHCKKLLEDGLRAFLDHMSNIAETEAEGCISYVNSDLLSRSFWQPSNLIIVSHYQHNPLILNYQRPLQRGVSIHWTFPFFFSQTTEINMRHKSCTLSKTTLH